MKVLTAEQMRTADRLTIEAGIPGLILMENAGSRVVDCLVDEYDSLGHVAVVCGKGNNGGDGFVVARQLFTRKLCRELDVYEIFDPGSLTGDAAVNRKMLAACGCPVRRGLPDQPILADILIDAVLGTGLTGCAKGPALDAIRTINTQLSGDVVSIDIPSGLPSEGGDTGGEYVRADLTVTFTAYKRSQVLSPLYERMGKLVLVPIGTPDDLVDSQLQLTAPDGLRQLFAPRNCNSNKGMYGHVLVVGGSYGKSGAPAMSGLGAFRAGAGLVTVAVPESVLPIVASFRPELMTVPARDPKDLMEIASKMTVLALGPGIGTADDATEIVNQLYGRVDAPMVVDADALNILACDFPETDKTRILTPHPGEMGRLAHISTQEVQANRLDVAQGFARQKRATVVLKGDRTVIAFPDGDTWINPTGSPALATGGTGDVLTGMIAGMVAQHPNDWKRAVLAGVWLHGRCGEFAGEAVGNEYVLATDILDYLPEAMDELRP